jgi:KAP family P-loop domain
VEKADRTKENYENNNSESENSIQIITDEPINDAPDFKKYTDQLSKLIVYSIPRFTVGIYGGWGTGKTTFMRMIKHEIDQKYSNNVETVWFDAWRYEKEQYSAMVPLLRTINLSLKNAIGNSKDIKKKKILTRIEGHVSKLGGHTTVNVAANVGAGSGGSQSDIGKIIDDYKSDGSVMHGQERIYFHKHITEHLQEELYKIRNEEYDFRIVIFVDDLDRCTPERALELLESIKTFFDIEGIVYVIGIDPITIDPLIQTKYGKESKVDGMHYLQKIVQLPFQIPVWDPADLSKTIRTMIARTGMHLSEFEPILEQTSTELIMNAAQLNPRDIKRFVNSIILATYVYEHDIKDIEKLIAIQAFYFRGAVWLKFLGLLIPYKNRIEFLKHFVLLVEKNREGTLSLEDLNRIIDDRDQKNRPAMTKPILDIYKKLVEFKDNDPLFFLRASASTLLKIDKIDKYLRVIENTSQTDKREIPLHADSKRQLELIKNGNVTDFNQLAAPQGVIQDVIIHHPFEELSSLKLNNIKLRGAFLFKTRLIEADLSEADYQRLI